VSQAIVPRSGSSWLHGERELAILLLGPAIVYIALLVGFPFLLALFYSVSDATVGSQKLAFVGLHNFRQIVDDPTFWRSMRNAIVFTLASQLLVVILGNVLALALQRDFPGKWWVRLLILLPWVAPISLGSIAWLWIFDPVYSIINWMLHAAACLAQGAADLAFSPELAMASVIWSMWRLPRWRP
jgi:multiple sugar transport system permease protein